MVAELVARNINPETVLYFEGLALVLVGVQMSGFKAFEWKS